MTERPYLSEREGDALVRVRLQPRSRRDKLVRLDGVGAAAVSELLP